MDQQYVNDFLKYIQYMLNEAKDTQPADKVTFYSFNHTIQLLINEDTQ